MKKSAKKTAKKRPARPKAPKADPKPEADLPPRVQLLLDWLEATDALRGLERLVQDARDRGVLEHNEGHYATTVVRSVIEQLDTDRPPVR